MVRGKGGYRLWGMESLRLCHLSVGQITGVKEGSGRCPEVGQRSLSPASPVPYKHASYR